MAAENEWAGAQLRARRQAAKKTQAEVADLAGIDRSRYNALENGRHAITVTYAERLAKVFREKDPQVFLPQPPRESADGTAMQSPLDLLHGLAATVDDLLETVDELRRQVASLQRRPATRRRATGES